MSTQEPIGVYINNASKRVRRSLDAIFYEYEHLTGMQACVLGEIFHADQDNEPYYQKNIEYHFGIRRSSANSIISSLEQNGYVMRSPVKEDARLKRLILTPKGQETCRHIEKRLDDFEMALSSIYTEEEKQLFISFLKRLIVQCPDPDPHQSPQIHHHERM